MGIKTLIIAVGGLISKLIIIVAGIALLVFFFGIVKYIFKADDPSSHEEGRNLMIWGLIALAVMVFTAGLITFIGRELNIRPENASQTR